jgi:hypothetical protein
MRSQTNISKEEEAPEIYNSVSMETIQQVSVKVTERSAAGASLEDNKAAAERLKASLSETQVSAGIKRKSDEQFEPDETEEILEESEVLPNKDDIPKKLENQSLQEKKLSLKKKRSQKIMYGFGSLDGRRDIIETNLRSRWTMFNSEIGTIFLYKLIIVLLTHMLKVFAGYSNIIIKGFNRGSGISHTTMHHLLLTLLQLVNCRSSLNWVLHLSLLSS